MGKGGNKTERVDIIDSYDPRVVGRAAQKGTFFRYIPSIGNPILLVKTDDGFSTNWSPVGGGSSAFTSKVILEGPIDYGDSGNNYDMNFTSNTVEGADLTYTPGGAGGSDLVTVITAGFYRISFIGIINDSDPNFWEYFFGVTRNRPPSAVDAFDSITNPALIAAAVNVLPGNINSYYNGTTIIELDANDILRFPAGNNFSQLNKVISLSVTIERVANPQG